VHLVKEADRPNADIRTWYRTPRWRALRAVVLRDQPFCPDCAADHRRVLTTDVDHIEKHHGDPQLFWNRQNLQAKCHAHHSAKTGRGE
jgi:5-methylcytosine-specific restriction endonuclease McrA